MVLQILQIILFWVVLKFAKSLVNTWPQLLTFNLKTSSIKNNKKFLCMMRFLSLLLEYLIECKEYVVNNF
jgi:hypothetical protein